MREDLKHAHSQAKKLEKSLAQEQKKVELPSLAQIPYLSIKVQTASSQGYDKVGQNLHSSNANVSVPNTSNANLNMSVA